MEDALAAPAVWPAEFAPLEARITSLLVQCEDCIEYTRANPRRSNKFFKAFNLIDAYLKQTRLFALELACNVGRFDFSAEVPGNGFRSLLGALSILLSRLQEPITEFQSGRASSVTFFFSADSLYDELDGYGRHILCNINRLLGMGVKIFQQADRPCNLFNDSPRFVVELLEELRGMDTRCFYGHLAAFQYTGRIQKIMGLVLSGMAGYSKGHKHFDNQIARGFVMAVEAAKYFVITDEQAFQIVQQFQERNPIFVRDFWNLLDATLVRDLPMVIGPEVTVNTVFHIPCVPMVTAGSAKGPDGSATSVVILPGVVSRLGELRAAHPDTDISDCGPLLLRCHAQLSACKTDEELRKVSDSIKAEMAGESLKPVEQEFVQSALFQVFNACKSHLAAQRQQASSGEAEEQQQTWQQSAGRSSGPAGYQLGDVTLSLLNMIGFSGKSSTEQNSSDFQDIPDFGSVTVRLISKRRRKGQILRLDHPGIEDGEAPSPGLLIHFHGGGFVSGGSRSHEVYTRKWAEALDVPILSVDYSLAPDAPFPRAMHECFYAYVWAVHNVHKLGSTGERIVVTGDSAGGNLCVVTALRALIEGVRAPDFICPQYPVLMVKSAVTPSRLLGSMDPLLALSNLEACLDAYLEGGKERHGDPLLSPLEAQDSLLLRLPPVRMIVALLDPLLDDGVQFARRLKRLGKDVELAVVDGMPHGFLNFHEVSDSGRAAYQRSLEFLRQSFAGAGQGDAS